MRTNTVVFWVLFVFFGVVSTGYAIWGIIDTGYIEWAGTVALALCAVLGAFIAFYLGRVHRAQGGELPEDRRDANIDDGDPELGHFSPWSWWPVTLAGSLALVFLGIAVGFWISFIGIALVAVSIVGWTFEYYRGNFAR